MEIGSSPNSKRLATYSVYIDLVEPKTLSGVTLNGLLDLIKLYRPRILAIDNFLELIGSIKKLNSLLNQMESTKLVQVTLNENSQQTITKLANSYLGWKSGKPNSKETAKLCVELVKSGIGSIITGYNRKSLQIESLQTQNSLNLSEKSLHPIQKANPYLEKRNILINFGKGKDAIIYLSEFNGEYHVLKYYDPYSPSIGKLDRSYASRKNTNITMAKRESRILSLLPDSFKCPQFIERSGEVVVMTAIGELKDSYFELAPQLSKLSKSSAYVENFLHASYDLLFSLFRDHGIVHGDFSPYNILVKNEELYLIDFAQAHEINFITFTDTPYKFRIDRGLMILQRDILNFAKYYSKKYRVSIDLHEIYDRFVGSVPQRLKKLCAEDLLILT